MFDFVELWAKRNRGWPWPEDSYGLTPMFGASGWCRECGTPLGPQTGSLTLQSKGLTVQGAWIPYWLSDVICLDAVLADEVASRFRVQLLPVQWSGSARAEAHQIVVPTVGQAWFDHAELRAKATELGRPAGSVCVSCGTCRWPPLGFAPMPAPFQHKTLPPLRVLPELGDVDVAASPEWFGDGFNSFRQVLVRRELAELIAAASPKDFVVRGVR